MAADKDSDVTLAKTIQFLVAHAKLLHDVHTYMGTMHPVTVGFTKATQPPSPATVSTLFSTSLPIYNDRTEQRIRNILHKKKKALLEAEVGKRLGIKTGRCVENLGVLAYVVF
jgi:hypothetical protein